ncbi:hypothetical protein LZY01_18990 [Levilactobacillus zymae]|uniref:Replication initiator protein A C-terminal domain-containing protein n=1 Tax=Levilactobacillus zymae TaxID=267363 RepID=A0ABQ0WYD0_9LACO|nr:hypothetical protein [Levilactobacillus zymae]QFR60576.1 hypothetical protein LZ395_03125 [Levilactobacillus zymae]GEO72731.1 hypothetical protein LZY01_18990 [Levilactobacillus zymae]
MLIKTQYLSLRLTLIRKHQLNPTLAVIYSALIDRMLSSRRQDRRFFDASRQSYFVNYAHSEMAANYFISSRTVQRAYDQLEEMGLLLKKHRRNASDCLFLPEMEGWLYAHQAKLARPDWSFWPTNHLTLNQSFKSTIKTANTSQVPRTSAQSNSAQANQATLTPAQITRSTDQPSEKLLTRLEFTNLTQSLTTVGGIPAATAQLMAALADHDHTRLYEMARVIYQAKAAVCRMAEAQLGSRGQSATRLEHNWVLLENLHTAVARIIPAAYRKNRQAWQGYAYVAFRRFFEEVANEWLRGQRDGMETG